MTTDELNLNWGAIGISEDADKPAWSSTITDDEWDFLEGKTCNPDAPEECESCQ